MSNHTPGPWHFEPGTEDFYPYVVRGKEGGFQLIGVSKERQEADARLIAAAPDLLEALERLLADYQALSDSGDAGFLCIEGHPVGKAAYAAIARAKG